MADYYVAPGASGSGDGSIGDPWTVAQAIAATGTVGAGDTVHLRGGTYDGFGGDLVWNYNGASGNPVTIRNYQTEKPIFDLYQSNPVLQNDFHLDGTYTDMMGLEIFNSDNDLASGQTESRISLESGNSHPADQNRGNVIIDGQDVRLVNCTIHDLQQGIFSGSAASNVTMYGLIVYNNGFVEANGVTPRGHGLYIQNATGTKLAKQCVIVANYSFGWHAFGSVAASVQNVSCTHSVLSGNNTQAVLGGGAPMTGGSFSTNDIWGPYVDLDFLGTDGHSCVVRDNRINNAQVRLHQTYSNSLEFTGNRSYIDPDNVAGDARCVRINAGGAPVPNGRYTWDNNAYHSTHGLPFVYINGAGASRTFQTWKDVTPTGPEWDEGSSFSTSAPADSVDVRPNAFDPDRALMIAYNYSKQPTVGLDLAGWLNVGDSYVIRHIYGLSGSVASGTYDGNPVSVNMADVVAPKPIGHPSKPNVVLPTEFGVFIGTRTSSTPPVETPVRQVYGFKRRR